MEILKEYWEGENSHKDEYLILDNISFVSSRSCVDCSFYETVKLSFEPCNEKGRTFVPSTTRFILMIEVNSGYYPVDNVVKDLRNGLSKFNILNIGDLLRLAAGMPIAFRRVMRAVIILSFGLQCIL